jgi:hypothetical protein
MSLTFLTPAGAVVAVALVLPLLASLGGRRHAERARRALRLAPAPRDRWSLPVLVVVVALLALAAAQPAVDRPAAQRTRLDAGVFVVFDVTRSMLAAPSPSARSRLARAKRFAVALRAQLPELPFGVATLTDRGVPLLFPTPDAAAFDSTVRAAVRVDAPPPVQLAPNATDFSRLADFGTQNYFAPAQRQRVVVLLTDGESIPFDDASVAAGLGGVKLVVVRFWRADERVFADGRAEPAYRPDPASASIVAELATATGGSALEQPTAGAAAAAVRRDAGRGPTRPLPARRRRMPIAPFLAAIDLLPLGVLLRRRLLTAP